MTHVKAPAIYLVPEDPTIASTGGRLRATSIAAALSRHFEVTLLAPDQTESSFAGWRLASRRNRSRRRSERMWIEDVISGVVSRRHTMLVRAMRADLLPAFAEIVAQTRPAMIVLERPFVDHFLDIGREHSAAVAVDAGEWMGRLNRHIFRNPGPWMPRVRALIEAYTLEPLERRSYLEADEIWAASPLEAAHFRRWVEPNRVRVVPNAAPVQTRAGQCQDGIQAVAYLGSYGHPPNEAAAIELMQRVMPAVRRLDGPRELRIIGRGPTSAMRRVADGETIITGEVPDAAAALCEAGLLVVPLRSGGGTRLKILEAAALGVPVVTTPKGLEGLDFVDEQSVLVAETVQDLAHAIVRLSRDDGLRLRLTASAKAVVRDRYSQAAVQNAIDASVSQLIAIGPLRRRETG